MDAGGHDADFGELRPLPPRGHVGADACFSSGSSRRLEVGCAVSPRLGEWLVSAGEIGRPPDGRADVVGQCRDQHGTDDERVQQHTERDGEAEFGQVDVTLLPVRPD